MIAALLLAVSGDLPKSGPLDLEELLRKDEGRFEEILDEHETVRLQLCVGEIVEREDGTLVLQRSTLGDLGVYFYPASSIKTAAAVAALEVLNDINAEHDTNFGVHSDAKYSWMDRDRLRGFGKIGDLFDRGPYGPFDLGSEIRKLSIVSNNGAFNRLYELAGQDGIDRSMERAGFASFHLVHRLSVRLNAKANRSYPSIILLDEEGREAHTIKARISEPLDVIEDIPGLLAGEKQRSGGELFDAPFRFHDKNRVHIEDLQDFLVEVVRPEIDTGKRGFPTLTKTQREFLSRAMSELPRESLDPVYDPEVFPDDYVKFLLPGLDRVLERSRIRIWNKVGLAYGFTVENAYVEDQATGRGFFVAATLYTNPNGIVNDGDYAYDEVAFPFYADLGEALGRYFFETR